MGALDRKAGFVDEFRKLKRRIADLERRQMARAQVELDANRSVEWVDATLENDFTNQLGGYAPAGFYIDSFGHVRVRGRVSQGATLAPATMFTLPVGYRPVYRHEFPTSAVYADSVTNSVVTVNTDGTVELTMGDAGVGFPINLDTIQFRTV